MFSPAFMFYASVYQHFKGDQNGTHCENSNVSRSFDIQSIMEFLKMNFNLLQ